MPPFVQPFTRVFVTFRPQGGSTVSWQLNPLFCPRRPWTFQLQVNEHNIPSYRADGTLRTNDNWLDVAGANWTVNAGNQAEVILADALQEAYGKLLNTFYRIQLFTQGPTYYSDPAAPFGILNLHDWLIFNEIIRKEQLRHIQETSIPGYVFKCKRSGTPCPVCLDPNTGEVTDSKCPTCFGTRWAGGYYEAVPGAYIDMGLVQRSERRGDDQDPGQHLPLVTSGRFINIPSLVDQDLWMEQASGLFHVIRPVETLAQVRNVPVVVKVELRQLPFDDVAFTLPLIGAPGG